MRGRGGGAGRRQIRRNLQFPAISPRDVVRPPGPQPHHSSRLTLLQRLVPGTRPGSYSAVETEVRGTGRGTSACGLDFPRALFQQSGGEIDSGMLSFRSQHPVVRATVTLLPHILSNARIGGPAVQ